MFSAISLFSCGSSAKNSERTVWEAIENTGLPYNDWVAYKKPGEPVLNILLEPQSGETLSETGTEKAIYEQILKADNDSYTNSSVHDSLADMIRFRVKVTILPCGAFAGYIAHKRAEGADLAHLKPSHINPPQKVIDILMDHPKTIPEYIGEPLSLKRKMPVG